MMQGSPVATGMDFVGLAPPNKAPRHPKFPNWNMKHYKSVEFLSNLNVKPSCTNSPRAQT